MFPRLLLISVGLSVAQGAPVQLFCASLGTASVEWCEATCNHDPAFCPAEFCFCSNDPNPVPPTQAHLTCGATLPATPEWCDEVCNFDTPFCPSNLCTCVPVDGTPAPTNSSSSCRSIRSPATDFWCDANCNAGFCPGDFCACGSGSPSSEVYVSRCAEFTDSFCTILCTTPGSLCPVGCCTPFVASHFSICSNTTDALCSALCDGQDTTQCPTSCCVETPSISVAPYNSTNCCLSDTKIFFAQGKNVFQLTASNGVAAASSVKLCGEFESPSDIKVDSAGGVFVTDESGIVAHLNSNCEKTVLADFSRDRLVQNPQSIAVADGKIFVSDVGSRAIWQLTLSPSNVIVQAANTGTSDRGVGDLALSDDLKTLFYVEDSARIKTLDLTTGETSLFFAPAAAISALAFSENCGLYFTAVDSNQVWRCSGPQNCAPLCTSGGTDSTSCSLLQNPSGVAVDCRCNLYVSNAANANLVFYPRALSQATSGRVLFSQINSHFGDVEIFTSNNTCAPAPTSLTFRGVTLAQIASVQDAIEAAIEATLGVFPEDVTLLSVIDVNGDVTVTFAVQSTNIQALNSNAFLSSLFGIVLVGTGVTTSVEFVGGETVNFFTPLACGALNSTTAGEQDLLGIGRPQARFELDLAEDTVVIVSSCNGVGFDTVFAAVAADHTLTDVHNCSGAPFTLTLPAGSHLFVVVGASADGAFVLDLNCFVVSNIASQPVVLDSPTVLFVTNGATVDDRLQNIPLNFSFPYFGQTFTTADVSSNGFVAFNAGFDSGCCSGDLFPERNTPNGVIAVAWTDLFSSIGSILVQSFPEFLAVSFEHMTKCCTLLQSDINAQLHLFPNGCFEAHYGNITLGGNNRIWSVGFESPDGRSGFGFLQRGSDVDFIPFQHTGFRVCPV